MPHPRSQANGTHDERANRLGGQMEDVWTTGRRDEPFVQRLAEGARWREAVMVGLLV